MIPFNRFTKILHVSQIIKRARTQRIWRSVCSTTSTATRNSDSDSDTSFIITTPIFYVNAAPHIGHVYSAVLADAGCRFQRLKNHSVLFSTGTDEHGLKIQKAAELKSQNAASYCSNVSSLFRKVLSDHDVSFSDFIRTTEVRHVTAVKSFWDRLVENRHIYMGHYEGWYCTSDETFLSESQTKVIASPDQPEKRISLESGHSVEWSSETNYMFRLSRFQDDLLHWLKDESVVRPSKFYHILKAWVEEGLDDLSVSRPRSRLNWGIPVPNDDSHTIYVWVDALVNYLTVAGYPGPLKRWPPDAQVIGKDILKFHGIYWPALLIAAGLEPPRSLLCHSHWTVDGQKMSKSLGNVVDPSVVEAQVTSSGLRYFLLQQGVPGSDGNFSFQKMVRVLNSELADTLGNLLQRCTARALNAEQCVPPVSEESFSQCGEVGEGLLSALKSLPDSVETKYADWNFYKGLEEIMAVLRTTNLLVQTMKPWELRKNPAQETILHAVLGVTLETLRISGILLQPVIPSLASKLLDKLSVDPSRRWWRDSQIKLCHTNELSQTPPTDLSPDSAIFFSRIHGAGAGTGETAPRPSA